MANAVAGSAKKWRANNDHHHHSLRGLGAAGRGGGEGAFEERKAMSPEAKALGGQPASPLAISFNPNSGEPIFCTQYAEVGGLTKREAFAMAAMQAIITAGGAKHNTIATIANDALKTADGLLEALTKT